MRLLLRHVIFGCAIASATQNAAAAESEKIPLNVLYLARNNESRADAFVDFLSNRFARCTTAKREAFEPDLLDGVDVVVLDWSQNERTSRDYKSPIGPLERWETPTVFLGSAGHLIAGPWYVIGGAG